LTTAPGIRAIITTDLTWRCSAKPQAPSNKLDKTSQIIYDGDIMRIRKKLVKEIKKTNPDLADEIKYMSVKDFKTLMEVFNVWCRL
jgi:hypothetical protein